jgi:hypothetical protein
MPRGYSTARGSCPPVQVGRCPERGRCANDLGPSESVSSLDGWLRREHGSPRLPAAPAPHRWMGGEAPLQRTPAAQLNGFWASDTSAFRNRPLFGNVRRQLWFAMPYRNDAE